MSQISQPVLFSVFDTFMFFYVFILNVFDVSKISFYLKFM